MFLPRCLATGIGSLPHTSADEALAAIARYLPGAPFWPQLPSRGKHESMCPQFLPGLPGWAGEERLTVDPAAITLEQRTEFFQRAFAAQEGGWPLDPGRTAGYQGFLEREWSPPARVLKGQITGPITMGISVTDPEDKPVLYNDEVMELICTQLAQLARGQERELAAKGDGEAVQTLIFLDEPWMAAYGSAFATFGRDAVIRYLSWVMEGLRGLKAVHCCANTDWSLLLATPLDVLSFDAYGYGDKVMLYATELAAFLERGGYLAWGIVPSEAPQAEKDTVDSLLAHLKPLGGQLAHHLPSLHYVWERSFITPACGLGNQSEGAAERILEMTALVAERMQREVEGGL